MNQYDVSRKQVLLPGGFCECAEIFKMADYGHESHFLVLLFLHFKNYSINGLHNNA